MSTITIIQKKSNIKKTERQKKILISLGLKGIGSKKTHNLTPSIKGMLKKLEHLVVVQN